MSKVSLIKSWIKIIAVCAVSLSGFSCTQEYLILVRNLDRTQWLSLDDVLHESGLEARTRPVEKKPDTVIPDNPLPRETEKVLPSTNIQKRLTVPADQDFSVQIPVDSNFIVLKSVLGGMKHLKDRSDPFNGLFQFHSGTEDGSIEFQTYSPDGKIDRSIVYLVRVNRKLPSATETANTNAKGRTNDQTNANVPSPNLSQMILSSIQGLSPTEAARELGKMLDSSEITDNDKEFIRYQLVDIMIAQRNYTPADGQIGLIKSDPVKTLYRARLQRAKGNQKEAVRNYIGLLAAPEETRKKAILELEDLLLEMGSADKGLLDSLQAETAKYKTDKAFYGTSMVRIAKIYPYLQEVYKARDILEKIIAGNYGDDVTADAEEALKSLKRDFLEYK